MEMRLQHQQKINQKLNTKAQSMNIVNNFQGRSRNTNYQKKRKDFTRYLIVPQNYQYTSTCADCRNNHSQISPTKWKNFSSCGVLGHSAKKFRKPKISQSQTSKLQQTKINQIDSTATKSDDEESVNFITSY